MLLRMAVVQKPFQLYVTWHSSAHLSDTLLEPGSPKLWKPEGGCSGFLTGAGFSKNPGAAGLKNWD